MAYALEIRHAIAKPIFRIPFSISETWCCWMPSFFASSLCVFWGGGIDTQRTLPFGTPEECRQQAIERCRVFSPGGEYVFNAIHNVQALTPIANIIAMTEGVKEFNAAGK